MLQFLPYALAAYGGYKGYQANKQAGASGINRLLGAVTGAGLGYYGGQAIPGVATSGFKGIPGLPVLPSVAKATAIQPSGPFPGLEKVAQTEERSALKKLADLFTRQRVEDGMVIEGETEIDPMKAGLAAFGLAYGSGAFKQKPVDLFTPTYNVNYGDFAEKRQGFKFIDPTTGEEKTYDKVYIPEGDRPENVERMGPYEISRNRFNKGGLAEVKKFNEGGINYLPSKTTHDENDANNYVRASGYVEDGAGVGDKDEDTMLAQLADGEFVTRADGVLGAGIIAGANPNSVKDMREKGAQYFYEQQKRYKRVFDIIQDANETKNKKN
jgi:hypothetical protein